MVTASVNPNPYPNPKTAFFKKKIDPDPSFTDSRRGGWWSVAVIVKEMLTGSL